MARHFIRGVISPTAVRQFMDRPRDDLSRWKFISDAELARRERKLPVKMPFWRKLQKHQKVCAVLGARMKKLLILNDTGTGKTFLSLALMEYFIRSGEARCSLILVPNKINKNEWAKQIDKHAPSLRYVVLRGRTEDKWRQIIDNPTAEAFIETYAGFAWLACDLKVNKAKKKKKKPELVPNPTKIKKLQRIFDGVYADESTFLANDDTLPYRLVKQLMKSASVGFLMAAKPFGRDVTMLWAQAFLIDGGHALGETMGLFRAAFFDAKPKFFGGVDWKLKPGMKERISEFLDDISISYPANDADMPRLFRDKVEVELQHDAEAYVEQAREAIKRAGGNQREMKNAFLRMRQISSGFLGYADDDTGERASFIFPENPKLDALEAKVQALGRQDEHKGIIFHEFHFSAGQIIKRMQANGFTDQATGKGKGLKYAVINGMIRDTDRAKNAFAEDDAVQWLILSNAAGGYGLNLQNARYGLYYESPVPVILRYQTEKRFDRQFSLHEHVFLWDFLVKGTADQSILDFHKEGKNLWKNILNTGV